MRAPTLAVLFALLAATTGEEFKKYDAAAVKRFDDELRRLGVASPTLSKPDEPVKLPDPTVSSAAGDIEGFWTKSQFGRPIAAFEGIPYAEPPQRFKVAQPLTKRLADFKAKKPGSVCPQYDMLIVKGLTGSEDCLFLNVYVPEKVKRGDNEKLPVMFFIHGGGYFTGQGDMYGSQNLLDKDVILVTINYRVGPLGFMTTEDGVIPANLGLKDQVAALRWVHDNIAAFGGNPNLVTVFGHSAGSSAAELLMMSPLTKGLIHRVIAMSGSPFSPWGLSRPGLMAENRKKAAENLGCPAEPSKELLACLLTKPALDIAKQALDDKAIVMKFRPVVEGDVPGAVIPHHPKKLLTDGPANDVPYMSGVTSEEGLLFTGGVNDFKALDEHFGQQATKMLFMSPEDTEKVASLRKTYLSPGTLTRTNLVELSYMFGDLLFVWPALKSERYRRQGAKAPSYFYYYNWPSKRSFLDFYLKYDLSKGNDYGVAHGDDLFALFSFPDKMEKTPQDVLMSMILTDIYSSFARDGVPSSKLVKTKWQPVSTKEIEYLHIKSPLNITMKKDLLPERISLLQKVFDGKQGNDGS